MPRLALTETVLVFEASPGWNWYGGEVTWSLMGSARAKSKGKRLATARDIPSLRSMLVGKQYTSSGFDVPGTLMAATVSVNENTLVQGAFASGQKLVTEKTTGTFRATMIPALNANGGMDPLSIREGTWRIRSGTSRGVTAS